MLITNKTVMTQKATAILIALDSSLVLFVKETFGLATVDISLDTTAIVMAGNFSSFSIVSPSSHEREVSVIPGFVLHVNSFSS